MDSTQGCILVVEDEAMIAMDLEDILQSAGFETVWCPSLSAAQRALDNGTCRAVITDGRLQQQSDGHSMASYVRRRHPRMPIVAYSAQAPVYWQDFVWDDAFIRVDKCYATSHVLHALTTLLAAAVSSQPARAHA